MRERYLIDKINKDLQEKIVLLAGPRQSGKTTLAKAIGKVSKDYAYFNWDYQPDRKNIINYQFPGEAKLLIFDELHKYKHWKNYIKGVYDKHKDKYRLLVTGSAKLDILRRGGDSLTGRYHYYVLHPFSLSELLGIKNNIKPFADLRFVKNEQSEEIFNQLWRFGPFPEPFLKKNPTFWRRWQTERVDRLLKEEIRDLKIIGDIADLQILADVLPTKVGSPLSINNLREDLEVAHKTMVNYLDILEMFYFHFRIYPFTAKKTRSLKKMSKLYLWDWSVLGNEGALLENMIVSHLLKLANYLQHNQGYKTQVHYLRDAEGREVDFLFTVDAKPWFAVETKVDSVEISPWLTYFGDRIKIPQLFQVVKQPNIDEYRQNIRVISASKFLTGLI